MKKKHHILWIIFFIPFILSSQVRFNITVGGLKASTPAYVTAFSEKDKKTAKVSKGAVSIELIRYAQYVVVVYQKGRKPYVLSLDTEHAPRLLEYRVGLQAGKTIQTDYSPLFHYSSKAGRYTYRKFDLDEVKDKPAFGSQMQEANEEIKRYFQTAKLPTVSASRAGLKDEAAMRKTEHMIGQEIYKLLGKKRALELELERLNGLGYKTVYPDADMKTQASACEHNLNMLRREQQYYQISYKLAKVELEKAEVIMNKRIKKGESYSEMELNKVREKFNRAKKQADVADLNYKNKKADCWELDLRADMQNTLSPEAKQVLELEISDIRLYQRKQNAKRLYTIHNKLAMDVTERNRLVELANAQKYVSDHAKARVGLVKNKIRKLQIQDKGTGRNTKNIAAAQRELVEKEELAFQAEMGYLEHMWNLRSRQDLDGQFVDDLYVRQTNLLNLENLPERARPEDFVAGYDPTSPLLEQFEALFESFVELSKKQDVRGEIQEVKFKDDFYEIVIDANGNKSYFKNNKPVTALTYRFETIKKYGEFLNNIRMEEEKKRKFLDLFKKRTEF